jgi:hypothetical protein
VMMSVCHGPFTDWMVNRLILRIKERAGSRTSRGG